MNKKSTKRQFLSFRFDYQLEGRVGGGRVLLESKNQLMNFFSNFLTIDLELLELHVIHRTIEIISNKKILFSSILLMETSRKNICSCWKMFCSVWFVKWASWLLSSTLELMLSCWNYRLREWRSCRQLKVSLTRQSELVHSFPMIYCPLNCLQQR